MRNRQAIVRNTSVVLNRSRVSAVALLSLAIVVVGTPASADASDAPSPGGPDKPRVVVPDTKPPTQPAPLVRPDPVPEPPGTRHGVAAVTAAAGITTVTWYEPASGVSDQQLYQALRAQRVAGLQDPAHAPVRPASATTCTWATATTEECPQVHWARNGHPHPQVYFVDHTSSAWPVSAAVPVWNEVHGVDSMYRWSQCPNVAGAHCVHVFNSNYGNTWWNGKTSYQYDGNRNFVDGQTLVLLNDFYNLSAAGHRKSTCHELGHALGLGHNSSTGSCMVVGDTVAPQLPNGDDFALAADIYRSF